MRKIISGLLALATLFAGLTLALGTAGSASAATDRRACVTRAEYNAIYRGMTQAKLFALLDGHGTLLTQQWDGYYDEVWVEDGYWDDVLGRRLLGLRLQRRDR